MHTAIADPAANAESVLRLARACHDDGVALAVFPELTLSGYSIEDILLQDALLDAVEDALLDVVAASADLLPVLVVGAPLRYQHRIYNTAVVIHRGRVLGVAPKSYLPTYREFYERRQMAAGDDVRGAIRMGDADVPFGPDLLFAAADLPGFVLHVEICEDMFVPMPPSARGRAGGCDGAGEPVRQPDHDRACRGPLPAGPLGVVALPGRLRLRRGGGGRVHHRPGLGRPDDDLGERRAAGRVRALPQGGAAFGRRRRPRPAALGAAADGHLRRQPRTPSRSTAESFRRIEFQLDPPTGDIGLRREVERFPFVPSDPERLEQDCYEAYNIQVAGLEQRLRALNYPKVVIGVSGGLDSTHALIVAARAMDREDRPRSDILAFTLPGFATGERTKGNAIRLAEALGVTFEEIDIKATAELMLKEIDHPFGRGEKVYDVTFENVQAGLRTDYLFRIANQRGGIVLGTGDLSELALGWSTYGVGDQMSHYNVNGGVPKTLIQHLIRWVISSSQFDDEVNEVLQSVLDTEITPELVPAGRGRRDPEQRGQGRPVCAAGLLAVPGAAVRVPAVEDRVPGLACLARRRARRLAAGIPRGQAAGLLAEGDSALAAGLRAAVLLVQPVQAVGDAERAQGVTRRVAVAARGLAGAVGHVGQDLAGRDRTRGSRGVTRLSG